MSLPFLKVALVGFGLMGGSLARALKALQAPPHLTALSDNPDELRRGLELGLLDETSEQGISALRDRDLVVYATPPSVTLKLMEEHAPSFPDDVTLTDMGSLNSPFLNRAEELGLEGRALASHPMAGGTGSGFTFSRDGLFQGARVWVSPGCAEEERVGGVEALWEAVGAAPVRIEAQAHDEKMAWVSHLPQLTSNALAAALGRAGIRSEDLGPGGRDLTRLAGSGPEMWRGILEGGSGVLREGLGAVEGLLAEIRCALEDGELDKVEALMAQTRKWLEAEE